MARGKRAPGNDEDARTVELFFSPWRDGTVVGANLAWRDHRGYHRVPLGHWRTDVARQDLHGKSVDAVVLLLLQRLVHRLESAPIGPYTNALTTPLAAGTGVPLGTIGGTVSGQDPLPGM